MYQCNCFAFSLSVYKLNYTIISLKYLLEWGQLCLCFSILCILLVISLHAWEVLPHVEVMWKTAFSSYREII